MTDQHNDGAAIAPDDYDNDDAAYFRTRAAWHLDRASVASDASTRNLHHKFAKLYHARALA
ncbi:hypothetical protein [Sphingomonas sp. M1A8_2b]